MIILVIGMGAAIGVLAYQLCMQKKYVQKIQREGIEKNNYLINMSHEIRTPLNGIIGLEYLMRENVDDPERLMIYLDKLKVSSQFLKNLVSDVLDISKIENGQLEIERIPLNLCSVLEEVQGIIQIQTEDAGIVFSMRVDIKESQILGDGVRLKQILLNLLGNAVKFTRKGGWVRLEVSQRQISTGRFETIFTISDNGCGMSERFLKRIWEPFEQEGEGGSRSGNGLGTTLCKSLTEQMGGTISVESELGAGTCFKVMIPCEAAGESERSEVSYGGKQETEMVPDKQTHESQVVLVADDNEINRDIVCEILHSKGYSTLEAVNGEEAVRIFQDSVPGSIASILMDIRMPVMDGYEATLAIRAIDRPDTDSVKVIALTANAFKEELEKARRSGMDGVITKPVDVEELLRILG